MAEEKYVHVWHAYVTASSACGVVFIWEKSFRLRLEALRLESSHSLLDEVDDWAAAWS